jgi:hypothetical protein
MYERTSNLPKRSLQVGKDCCHVHIRRQVQVFTSVRVRNDFLFRKDFLGPLHFRKDCLYWEIAVKKE